MEEERWLNASTPDCDTTVLDSGPGNAVWQPPVGWLWVGLLGVQTYEYILVLYTYVEIEQYITLWVCK